jgi:hypothetical protein
VTSPNLPPSAVVSEVLAQAGVTPAAQAKVNANIATVQKAAVALCRIKPLASGLLNIGIALSPSLASVAGSGIAQEVGGVATIACNALQSAPTYAALGNRKGSSSAPSHICRTAVTCRSTASARDKGRHRHGRSDPHA